jgi:hypothetical protein
LLIERTHVVRGIRLSLQGRWRAKLKCQVDGPLGHLLKHRAKILSIAKLPRPHFKRAPTDLDLVVV